MYILKLLHLLRNFRAFGQSGVLYLEPLQEQPEEPWKAYLQLSQGEVTSCVVQKKDGDQLLWKDTQAIQWLATKEGLFWSLEESSHISSQPLASPALPPDHLDQPDLGPRALQVAHQRKSDKQEVALPFREGFSQGLQDASLLLVPQRTDTQAESSTVLPREHKRIFALVDGHRTSAQIGQLLHCPSQRVIQILRELQIKRLVEL